MCDKLCVSKLYDDKLCVSNLCDDKLCEEVVCGQCVDKRRREEEEEADGGIQNQKEKPHTKMWGMKRYLPARRSSAKARKGVIAV